MKDYRRANPGRWFIYYRRQPLFRFDPGVTVENMEETHQIVTTREATNCSHAYCEMQAENWSPKGEARPLIANLGLHHTSMSVGDIMCDPSGTFWQVDDVGFMEVPRYGQRFSSLDEGWPFTVPAGQGLAYEAIGPTWIKETGAMWNAHMAGDKLHKATFGPDTIVLALPF